MLLNDLSGQCVDGRFVCNVNNMTCYLDSVIFQHGLSLGQRCWVDFTDRNISTCFSQQHSKVATHT